MPTNAELKAQLEASLIGKLVRIHSTEGAGNSIPLIVAGVHAVERNQVWLATLSGGRYYYYINPATRPESRPANWHLEIYGEECPYAN